MPLYDYECPTCRSKDERLTKASDNNQFCTTCGVRMKRLISAPRTAPERFPYVHHNLGPEPVVIHSRSQERREFIQRGLVDAR